MTVHEQPPAVGAGLPPDAAGLIPDAAERLRSALQLLAEHPRSSVVALTEIGLFTPMPEGVPLTRHVVVEGHSTGLELVVPSDIEVLIAGWQRVRATGAGVVEVHPLLAPNTTMHMHFVDVREQYGVFLCVIEYPGGSSLPAGAGDRGVFRARVSFTRKNATGEFLRVDDAFRSLLGYHTAEVIGNRNLDLVHPDDHGLAFANWVDMLAAPGEGRRVRLRLKHADGRWIWFEMTNFNRLADPEENCVVTEMVDISEEMAAQEQLHASERLLRRLTESLPVGVVQVDPDGIVVFRNRRVDEIVGCASAGTVEEVFARVVEPDRPALHDAIDAMLMRSDDADLEVTVRRAEGTEVRCRLALRALLGESGESIGAIVCIDDVTLSASLRDALQDRATFDPLTRCHNRASILTSLEEALNAARADRTGVAVVFIDLDGFKAVNDRRGHAAGDVLLTRIGRCLTDAVRHDDLVGRVGGDEFLAVGRGIESAAQAAALGDRIAAALSSGIAPEPPHRAVASIGVAWTSARGADAALDADLLVARGDAAMYASKRAGDGLPVLHCPAPGTS